jgi:hypothetical protein
MEIRSPGEGSPVVVRTAARFAGAVSSIMRDEMEYIDTRDHGRLLQSAAFFDGLGECLNPTEGGSRDDGRTSTSRLFAARAGSGWLETETDMAFWLPPGSGYVRSCGRRADVHAAVNRAPRAGYLLSKRIAFVDEVPHLFVYDASFNVPEPHESAVFEVIAGYMPRAFAARWELDLATRSVEPADARPGGRVRPVIRATADGRHAMGVWSPDIPPGQRGYGLIEFPDVVKLNCVVREGAVRPRAAYRYRCYVAVGTLDEVRAALLDAAARFAPGRH